MDAFIKHLLSNSNFDLERVLEIIECATSGNTSEIMRIMSYITGFSDKPNVPETSTIREQATLTSYNFVENEVSYKYLASRKCSVKEENAQLDGKIFADFYEIPNSVRNNSGTIEITVHYWSTERCSLDRWLKD